MPTYEYVCEKCGHQFEKVQPISAKALTVCPKELCAQKRWGAGKVKRAITGGQVCFSKVPVSTSLITAARSTRRPRKKTRLRRLQLQTAKLRKQNRSRPQKPRP